MTSSATHEWGRIDEDGNVYVRVGDSERLIGQWLGGDPSEGLAMYERRFQGLVTEVELLETRLNGGTIPPDKAAKSVETIREQISGAQALGDLDGLLRRLDALGPMIDRLREARRAERAERLEEARQTKNQIVDEAEQIAESTDYKQGADRMRELLDEWKTAPRLEKNTDDELWHRFSAARTTFTRKRKAHFAEQAARRDEAARIKDKLIGEAEALSDSTDWGPTSAKFRDLMKRWKQAGPAPRKIEDKLWKRFRAAQDAFFAARDSANAELDAQYEANAQAKEQLLGEAEALLPVTDIETARKSWHSIADRWESAGKVPRSRMKELESRFKAVEQAIRGAENDKWQQSDPEKSARADTVIAKLQASINQIEDDLKTARAQSDAETVTRLEAELSSRKTFLETAQQASSDFQ